jgi:primosomal replication protein N
MHTTYWLQNLKGRTHLEDSGTDRRVILKIDIKVKGFQDVEWIHLSQKQGTVPSLGGFSGQLQSYRNNGYLHA